LLSARFHFDKKHEKIITFCADFLRDKTICKNEEEEKTLIKSLKALVISKKDNSHLENVEFSFRIDTINFLIKNLNCENKNYSGILYILLSYCRNYNTLRLLNNSAEKISSTVSKLISGFRVEEKNIEILGQGIFILLKLSKFSQKNVFVNIAKHNVLILLCNFLKYIYPDYSTKARGKGFEGEMAGTMITAILSLLLRTVEDNEILGIIPVDDVKFILSTLFEVIENIKCFENADQFYCACYSLYKIFLFGANNKEVANNKEEANNLFLQELLSNVQTVVDAYNFISDGVNVVTAAQQSKVGEGEKHNLFKNMFSTYLSIILNSNDDPSIKKNTIVSVEKGNDLISVSSEEGKYSAEVVQNLKNNLQNAKELILLELFDLLALILGCGLKGVNYSGLKFINV
jgi:hypothetical protein